MSHTHSVLTVIGRDRIGIVFDVSKLLAEHQINILNISQQLMGGYFTMIILMDTARCPDSREDMLRVFDEAGKRLGLDIRMQNEALFQAMHRI
ncbi:hypothetical protein A7P95_03980 [Eikenella longinqua]|uniref:UPF0237 protein A7P95_03980 n=1 Tax=Eikenella longinqua TaxID=1795827 RepID=A0A1A9RYP5_9NEIS|nr:ACT domain-containing protein [Eikenella longinqua]OAM29377.1 hypothetical protein A7P95_03980 [Eikenella longinqua]